MTNACDPLLSLSSTKQPKRRKIVKNVNSVENDDNSHEVERALHVCSPRRNVNSVENDDNCPEVEIAQHVCSPRCSSLNSSCPVAEPRDGEKSEEDDILNTSDHNENDLQDISAEIESLDGDLDMEFEEIDEDGETDDVSDKPEKKKRGENIGYVLIEN